MHSTKTSLLQVLNIPEPPASELEDAEDYALSSIVLARIRNGDEATLGAAEVRLSLGLVYE